VDLTPENVVHTQELLGSDLIMPLDVCLGPDASQQEASAALDRTRRWLIRARTAHQRADQQLFGIVQGGMSADLRRQAARDLSSLDCPGFAIGGLSVGEPREVTDRLVRLTAAELPADRPRYLMGVGTPDQIVAYAGAGVDMFDCVLPTRLGRTGTAFSDGRKLNLTRPAFRADLLPIDEACDCATCARFSRASLHTAFQQNPALGARLVSLHNVRALTHQAEQVRAAILAGTFDQMARSATVVDLPPAGPARPAALRTGFAVDAQ
jgi:queuine tRNA-ribosyltransferase